MLQAWCPIRPWNVSLDSMGLPFSGTCPTSPLDSLERTATGPGPAYVRTTLPRRPWTSLLLDSSKRALSDRDMTQERFKQEEPRHVASQIIEPKLHLSVRKSGRVAGPRTLHRTPHFETTSPVKDEPHVQASSGTPQHAPQDTNMTTPSSSVCSRSDCARR